MDADGETGVRVPPEAADPSFVAQRIFKPIWLGDERRKALIFRHAGCERPALLDESGGYENAHVGLIAGWLAGQIVQGTGFGIVGDLIVGIVGAFIGSWLLPQLGIHLGSGIIAAIINATIGALIL